MKFLLASFFPSHSMIPFQYVPEIFGVFFLKFSSQASEAGMYGLFPQDLARPSLLIPVRKPDFVNVDGEV